MPKVAVYNSDGQVVGEIDLNDKVFGADVNEALLHQAIVMYQANFRQGTSATKTRGLISGGGKKPWRQKGTGRARQGSTRAPQWRGGGTVFGPSPRDYRQTMPKKARQAALRSALSAKTAAGEVIVLEDLAMEEAKTKIMARVLGNLNAGKALIVTPVVQTNVTLSARNIPGVGLSPADSLNAYKVLVHDKLVITRAAVQRLEEALA